MNRSKTSPRVVRTFAARARKILEANLPQARRGDAHWGSGANLAWLRWPTADGRWAYAALRRHLDWVTGEVALSGAPRGLEDLPLGSAIGDAAGEERVRLGVLLHEEDRWWPAGDGEAALEEQLKWLALQLAVVGERWLRRRGAA